MSSDISFTLRKGEILGIAGLAKAGQSELLRAVVGADAQRARDLDMQGVSQPRQTPASAWRRGFAYVPRERRREGLALSRSITDNVTLPHLGRTSLMSVFLDRRRERAMAGDVGRQVRLKAARLSQLCRQLSGGNQQKVVFARAIAGQPVGPAARRADARRRCRREIRHLCADPRAQRGRHVGADGLLGSSRAARDCRTASSSCATAGSTPSCRRRAEPGRSAASVLRRLTANSGAPA